MRWIIAALALCLSACATAPGGGAQWGDIKLARTPCFGFCPDYEVTIAADGAVTYIGRRFTRVQGVQHGQADPAALAALRAHIAAADFFNLRDAYRAPITDLPTYSVTVTRGGRTKTVVDYAGTSVGMPRAVRAIEDEIDRVAGTAQWVPGASPQTAPAAP